MKVRILNRNFRRKLSKMPRFLERLGVSQLKVSHKPNPRSKNNKKSIKSRNPRGKRSEHGFQRRLHSIFDLNYIAIDLYRNHI